MDLNVVLQVVIVFGVIIFVHELGHFLACKLVGVGVERFSLGFGPKIIGKKVGETEYQISAIPLGGYVKMVGEEIGEELPNTDTSKSFPHKSLPRRFLVVAAGPLFNIIAAFALFAFLFWSFGVSVPLEVAKIGNVLPDLPAEKAGLQAGDEVLQVNDDNVKSWTEMAEKIRQSNGQPTRLTIQREAGVPPVQIMVTPEKRTNGETDSYVIGIEGTFQQESVSLGRAVVLGAQQTWGWTAMITQSLVMLLSGQVSAKELGGPILIAQVAGQQARRGLEYLIRFMAVININLAVFNLLPLPTLDGGHLFFFTIEALRGRPLSLRAREMALRVGFFVIITLIVFVMYNDIARLVG